MSAEIEGFRMGWVAGPSAEIELYTRGESRESSFYEVRYTPAFHSTIRPPLTRRPVGPTQIDRINQRLEELVQSVTTRSGAAAGAEPAPGVAREAHLRQITMLGRQLHDFLMPRHVQSDLAGGGLFLEVGMGESLLHLPWELMHDGDNFLCLKHCLGRFVNTDVRDASMAERPPTHLGSAPEPLLVLLICVPEPQPRDEKTKYDPLPEAARETKEVQTILSDEGVEFHLLMARTATYDGVWEALENNQYHIIHYSGHARFDDEHPYLSGLVLWDTDMTTGELKTIISPRPPILCFINGCETGKSPTSTSLRESFDIFGLARAFLDTGAYLMGSRWKINDRSAAEFAKAFYTALIAEGKPIGMATIDARYACRTEVPEDIFGWSSYVFYGDPRICFRMR